MKVRGGSRQRKKTPPNFQGAPGSLRVVAGEYIEWLRERNYSEMTAVSRTTDLLRFLDWCDERGLVVPMEITQPILEGYQRWLFYHRRPNGRPLGASTQHHLLASVKGLFRWLTRSRRTLFNPAAELELPKVGTRLPRDVLTAQEVDWVINQADLTAPLGVRDRAILETFYSTGMRRKEVAQLKIHDLDVARGTVMVREGKGLKDRVVPIGKRALAWIETYLTSVRPRIQIEPDEGYLFLMGDGRPFRAASALTEMVRRYVKQADIGKVGGCHVFRHAMATLLLENGADIRYIQEILGHASVATTQIYTRVSIQKLKQIHQAAHPAEQTWKDPGSPAAEAATAQALLEALAIDAQDEDELDEL